VNAEAETTNSARPRFSPEVAYQAARLYYEQEATQADIAQALSVSRPTVSRLLAEARRLGIVRIEVVDPRGDERAELAERLRRALGLEAVRVVPPVNLQHPGPDLAPAVGEAIAAMNLAPGDVLLLSSGRTVYEIVRQPLPRMAGVQLVPGVGGMSEPVAWFQTNEISRQAAERTGAFPAFVFAEALPTASMRRSLDDDPSFQHVTGMWRRASGAVLGIGAPTASRETVSRFVAADASYFTYAVGDVCMNFFDIDGDPLEFPGSDRMVRTPRTVLQAMPHTVGVAVGLEKVTSIIGAARARLVRELVTDGPTARAVLQHLARHGRSAE
jgi:DNA-binding transcriptional regulator LsrR (DeoR family)